MKVRLYVRLARTERARDGWKVEATTSPNPRPLTVGIPPEDLHTVRFALQVDVPEEMLRPARWPTVEVQIPASVIEQLPQVVPVESDTADTADTAA